MLELAGVTKVYETGGLKHRALDKVSINFRASEFVAILGPSGSGKTTLLNIIGGLDHYTNGELKINEVSTRNFHDKNWDAYRNHRIGFVFQSYNLIPHQTVLSNVKLALTLSGISKREATRRAKKALGDVGLKDHVYKRPNQLSGGQMQRVAIARALVNDPDILLADEPTGALDSETSVQIMNLLKEIAKDKLVIMVTHNPELAEEYATRIVMLKDGKITSDSDAYDGKIKTNLSSEESSRRRRKTKMSFVTALGLSLNNLLTKKGRTILVSIAGSIGIIGIALISAVSTGFQNYIDKIEQDTLTSYPLTLMKESTNATEILLNIAGTGNQISSDDGKVHESQILSSTLGSVSKNDLKSFREYLGRHYDELDDSIHLIENEYNIDPMVYTIDATGELAKLNPNDLFSSILGSGSLMNSYSSLTSAFMQYDIKNIKADTEIVAGRYPENYNELVIMLPNSGQISDFLTFSLGFHDTDKLSEMIAKIMGGENIEYDEEPLTLTYEELMGAKLKLVLPADTYKYNEKYDVYEDMSNNMDFMNDVYNNKSEELKIVGVVTPTSELMNKSGILYLPSLVTHIIEESSKTEIVKRQLADPSMDVFSGVKFGEEKNDFDFEFSDLVSVDSEALAKAFNVTIDQNAVKAKTEEYMTEITGDIAEGTKEMPTIRSVLIERFKILANEFIKKMTQKITDEEISLPDLLIDKETALNFLSNLLDEFIAEEDFSDLTAKYIVPEEQFKMMYGGLLEAFALDYLQSMLAEKTLNMNDFLATVKISGVFDNFAVNAAQIFLKQSILTKVGGLTTYLSNSFANAFNINEDAIISAFTLNFTEDELSRVVTAMFTKKESTLSTNLSLLGYQDLEDPFEIDFYFSSFEGKTKFIEFLDGYNELMRSYNSEDKVIDYTDTTGILMSSVKTIVDAVSYVLIAFVSISLVVSSIMIGIITYISVYERTKEIGILRAIGASKHNISNIFNAETFIIGGLSGLFGVIIAYLLIPPINLLLHHFTGDVPLSAALDPKMAGFLIVLSVILTLIGGIIPARAASKKDPVEALRSE